MDVVRALFVTLAVLVAIYVARWWTCPFAIALAAPRPVGPCGSARAHTHRDRIHHELLRHARHRLVRDDDDDLQAPAARAGRADSRHDAGRVIRCPWSVQAFAFISVVSVDPLAAGPAHRRDDGWRLASAAGAASRLPRRVIQLTMATGLLLAGLFMTMGMLQPLSGRRQRSEPHACAPRRGARRPTSSSAPSGPSASATMGRAWSSSACSAWNRARRSQS